MAGSVLQSAAHCVYGTLHTRVPVDALTVSKIRAVRGIHAAHEHGRYAVFIQRGAAFDWSELEPMLLTVADEIAAEMESVRALIESARGETFAKAKGE